jgi:hypothetical protein
MECIRRSICEPFSFSVDAIAHLDLPTAASWAVRCVHFCHFLGRSLSRLELRRCHPGLYLGGVLANAHYGDTAFLKVAAQLVRLAQVFFSAVEESGKLVLSLNRLQDSMAFSAPMAIPYARNRLLHEQWPHQEGKAPSVLFLPWPINFIASRLLLAARRIAEVAVRIWHLNLCLFDLYDAVWMNPQSRSESMDDIFINLSDIADQCMSRERRLSQAIAAHAQWIDKMLKIVRVDWTATKLAAILNEFADRAETIGRVGAVPGEAMKTMATGSLAVARAMVTNYSS